MVAAERARRLLLATGLGLALALTVAPPARADAESDVDKGRNAYLARQYDEADARFRSMLDPSTGSVKDPALVSQARMLWGAVKVAQKKNGEASQLFEELITKDPQFEPDPLSFPTEVLDVFSDTKHRIRERLAVVARENARLEAERRAREEADKKREAERVTRLEKLASEEKVRIKRDRYVAFIPFGAGQFQNGQTALGWTFLASEAALVAVGTVVVPFYLSERKAMTDYDPAYQPDATKQALIHRDNALRLQIVNLAAYGLFAATAIGGIVEANLAYEAETVRVQKRDPKELGPTVSAPPSGSGGGGTPNGSPAPSEGGRSKRQARASGLQWWPSIVPVRSGLTGGVEARW